MLKKHIIFHILDSILAPVWPVFLKRIDFYKALPSKKLSVLWLASWPSALWLSEHRSVKQRVSEMKP